MVFWGALWWISFSYCPEVLRDPLGQSRELFARSAKVGAAPSTTRAAAISNLSRRKRRECSPVKLMCVCEPKIWKEMLSTVHVALFSLPSSTPPIVQTVTWSLPSPPSCGSSRCGMPGIARDRAVANLLMTSLPKSVARSKNASARVSERKSLCVTCYVTVHFLLQSAKRRELPQTIFSLLARNFFDTFVVDSLRWRDQLGTRWKPRRRRRPKRDVKFHWN